MKINAATLQCLISLLACPFSVAQDGEGEVERAARLLGEKGVDLSDDRGRSRALGMLARRGYGAEEAYAAIRRARPAA